MKPVLNKLVVLLAIALMVTDSFAILGVRRRTRRRVRRRTAVVVGTAAAASSAAATTAAQQQAATAEAEAAAAKKEAAAADQKAAAAEKEAAAAKKQAAGKPLPLGTVLPTAPTGCTPKAIGGVTYYVGGGNYYRAVFQGTSLVYVTVAKPK